MDVLAFDRKSCEREPQQDDEVRPPGGFWRGLARTLDRLGAYPTSNALSRGELRRVAADIERCHGLMSGGVRHGDAILGRARRTARAGW